MSIDTILLHLPKKLTTKYLDYKSHREKEKVLTNRIISCEVLDKINQDGNEAETVSIRYKTIEGMPIVYYDELYS